MAQPNQTRPDAKDDSKIKPILTFIQSHVRSSKSSGVVVAISGGIDSAVVASLAVRSLGPKKVLGLLLFEDEGKKSQDYSDAKKLISSLGIASEEITITPIIESFRQKLKKFDPSRRVLGNVKARVRMILLYAFANERNLLVVGTGDRSEELLGYFTKFGDGGVDIQPIAHLYKTQVRRLAKGLGISDSIIDKESSPNLWEGQKARDELPFDYPILDQVLHLLYERSKDPRIVAQKIGVPLDQVKRVVALHEKNMHKLKQSPSLEESYF